MAANDPTLIFPHELPQVTPTLPDLIFLERNNGDGTYSDYGPATGAASYTFASPTGGTASVSGSTSVGSNAADAIPIPDVLKKFRRLMFILFLLG